MGPRGKLIAVGLGVALAVAALSPLASTSKDGLEKVLEDQKVEVPEAKRPFPAPLPEYGEDGGARKKIFSGVVGTLVTFGLAWGVAAAVKRRKAAPEPPPPGA